MAQIPLVFAFRQLWFSFQLFFSYVTLSNPNGVQLCISIHYIHTIAVVRLKIHHDFFSESLSFSMSLKTFPECSLDFSLDMTEFFKKRCQDSQRCLDGVNIFAVN